MNKRSLLLSFVVATAQAFLANQAVAAVPPVEKPGLPAYITCPTSLGTVPITTNRIWHSDKIIFQIGTGTLTPIIAADFNALNALPRSTQLDIKVRDNPTAVADLKSKVLSFLGADPNNAVNRGLIRIEDVEYAEIFCPKPSLL